MILPIELERHKLDQRAARNIKKKVSGQTHGFFEVKLRRFRRTNKVKNDIRNKEPDLIHYEVCKIFVGRGGEGGEGGER